MNSAKENPKHKHSAGGEKGSHLYQAADDLGKHVEGKPKDVKKRDRHKGRLRIQDVFFIHSYIHGKCCQGNLETHGKNRPLRHQGSSV